MNNRFIGLFLLFKTSKMNGHFLGFHRLIKKLELSWFMGSWVLAEYVWIFDTWHAIYREMISSASQVYAMFSSLGPVMMLRYIWNIKKCSQWSGHIKRSLPYSFSISNMTMNEQLRHVCQTKIDNLQELNQWHGSPCETLTSMCRASGR